MYLFIRFLRKLFKVLNSAALPWQVGLGAFFGVLLGFLPLFPSAHGPAPLGWAVLLVALVINCHLGSMLMIMGACKLIAMMLTGPATALGNSADGLAQASANIPFLHASLWSHTTYLGMSLIGLIAAPIAAVAMWKLTLTFRTVWREKLLAKRRLVKAGKVGSSMVVARVLCWFFDL